MDDDNTPRCEELDCTNKPDDCPRRGCANTGRYCWEHADPEADFCDDCTKQRHYCAVCRRWFWAAAKRPVRHGYATAICHSCFRKTEKEVEQARALFRESSVKK